MDLPWVYPAAITYKGLDLGFGLGFGVWDLGFGVWVWDWGLGFGIWVSELRLFFF